MTSEPARTSDDPHADTLAETADDTAAPEAVAPKFSDFHLAEPIARAVVDMGYDTPTPIQAKAIPVVMAGVDVMGAAQTGTGKTAGFALPILQRLIRHENSSASPARHPVRALILAPTRELADQIHVNVAAYSKHTKLRSTVVYGGMDIQPQIQALRRGCEVLTATPGRLLDHVGQKTVQLGAVEVLVLDEADRMLDMGFLPDIQRIIQLLPKRRQNLMFSATFSREIRKLSESFLNSPTLIEVARPNAAAENVEQQIYQVANGDRKRAAVSHLIRKRDISQVIVFTNTKIGASRLARQLTQDGLPADAIHGDKSQQERLATLDGFKKGDVKILVATDVAARGLDIAELPAVINFDLPYSPEDYIHRIGRTGRAGASGLALSLMSAEDERLRAEIAKLIKRDLKPIALDIATADDEYRGGSRSRARSDSRSDARPSRSRNQSTRSRATPKPAEPQDPLFSQPYQEPEVPHDEKAPTETANRGSALSARPVPISAARRRRGPIPALLGGLKKAS